jgi:hypothetical protein
MMPKNDKRVYSAELGRSVQARGEKVRKAKKALDPEDEVENLYAEDWAETGVYKTDLDRAVRRRITSMMSEVLYNLLCRDNIIQNEQALDLVHRWAKGDPDARREVETWLESNGMTEGDVEAEAMLRSLSTLQTVDQLQTAASARRDKALSGLVFWRQQRRQAKDDE